MTVTTQPSQFSMSNEQAIELLVKLYRDYEAVYVHPKEEYKIALVKAIAALGFVDSYLKGGEQP